MLNKILSRRFLFMGVSCMALATLFCGCGEPDEPSNPDDNATYYRVNMLNEEVACEDE